MEWLMPVNSLQKQEGRHVPMSCARARRLDYRVAEVSKIPGDFRMNIKNSEEQRKTARHAAVFAPHYSCETQDFRGEEQRLR
jgi:hypothetical protein